DNIITREGREFLKSLKGEFTILDHDLSSAEISKIHVDVNYVDGVELQLEKLRGKKASYINALFILDNGSITSIESNNLSGKYICGAEVEKMSKSKFNTVNPDIIVDKYGADTFRMYEMFLGPIDQSKPW